jgi:hypothetical protein
MVGVAENKLDSGPIMFSPDELNTFYSLDVVRNLPQYCLLKSHAVGLDGIPLKSLKLILPGLISPIAHIFN